MKTILVAFIILTIASFGLSDFQEKTDTTFADQHFKTSITLMEL